MNVYHCIQFKAFYLAIIKSCLKSHKFQCTALQSIRRNSVTAMRTELKHNEPYLCEHLYIKLGW
jgi:hypothetical protein